MSSTHQTGRLVAKRCAIEEVDSGNPIGETWREEHGRRLVACWNACIGVPIEVLENQMAGGLPWNVGDRIDEKVQTDRRMQAMVDALSATETYIAERVSSKAGSTGATKILPMIRAAIEGAGVAPTQTSWGDFPA